jgi:hypothetical protein
MIGGLIVTHGRLAIELLNAAEMIVGEIRDSDGDALAGDQEVRGAERGEHILVAGERKEPQLLVVMDRKLVAEPAVDGVGVLVQLGVVRVELHELFSCAMARLRPSTSSTTFTLTGTACLQN